MHRTKNDLPESKRTPVVQLLNDRLVEALDLQLQAKQAHWNVKGPSFIALHELFDEVAEMAREAADLIAERATALGGVAEGTSQVIVQRSKLPPYPLNIKDGLAHVDALSTTLADVAKSMRSSIDRADELGDKDTADLFTELSRDVDKHLWLVEAHIQAER
jgi:starvation-inducible DNA-binding protein